MRVNVIGTYNALEAAVATPRHARAPRRVLDERGVRAARVQRPGGARDDHRLGRRGTLDVRGVEARRRAHGARLPRGARPAGGLGASVQHLRARTDRRRRDQGVHRGGARGTGSRDPRRRLADPRLVLRRRHGRGDAARARAPRRRRRELQHRQRTLRGHDLRPRARGSSGSPDARARSASSRSTTRTSSCGSRTWTRRGRCSGSRRASSSTRGSSGRSRGIAPGSARRREPRGHSRADQARATRRRRGRARRGRRGARERAADDGALGRRVRGGARAARWARRTRSPSRRGRRRSTWPCSRSASGRATR